ncbi:MAG: hypothetical protein KW806_02610, partial [Candidatus Yanofskybacteria bacterium]|nr:hypothetical protein [Candidatus Yanofskybacteria bacterium]
IVWGPDTTLASFVADINKVAINGGELKAIGATKGQGGSLPELLTSLGVTYPPTLNNVLGTDYIFLVFGQQETFNTKGGPLLGPVQRRIAFVVEARDSVSLNQLLSEWEPQMTDALAKLFELNKAKAASPGFLSNVYQSTAIRYRNFTYPDRNIDYGIVTAKNGRQYLVVTDSREAFFQVTNNLR